MISEYKHLIFIVWSVLVLPLLAAVFTFGIFMIVEFDQVHVGDQLVALAAGW